MISNQEFVAALVHGRRSCMAEGARLRGFAQTGTVAEVTGHVLTQPAAASAAEAQLRLVQGLAEEMTELVPYLDEAAAELVRWMARRFQVENLKLMIRRVMAGAPAEAVKAHLVRLPLELNGGVKGLSEAESLKVLARSMPRGLLRRELIKAMDLYHEQPRSFFFEAALDRGYFQSCSSGPARCPVRRARSFARSRSGNRHLPPHAPDTRKVCLRLGTRGASASARPRDKHSTHALCVAVGGNGPASRRLRVHWTGGRRGNWGRNRIGARRICGPRVARASGLEPLLRRRPTRRSGAVTWGRRLSRPISNCAGLK